MTEMAHERDRGCMTFDLGACEKPNCRKVEAKDTVLGGGVKSGTGLWEPVKSKQQTKI